MATARLCSTLIYPREVPFPSKSAPGVIHTVVTGSILNDSFCTCIGWHNRGYCSHQKLMDETACDWIGGPVENFPVELDECPKCGAPVEDYELDPEYA